MIRVRVDLDRAMFHGLRDDTSVDWPPSPARLIGALLGGAFALEGSERQSALDAVQLISGAPAPVILAPPAVDLELPHTFTDKTALPRTKVTGGQLSPLMSMTEFSMDATNRTAKPMGAVALLGTGIEFHVDVTLSDMQLQALQQAAQTVPYFGRSHDPAALIVEEIPQEHPVLTPSEDAVTWYPSEDSRGQTRGWTTATVERYDINHERVFGTAPAVNQLPPLGADGYTQPLRYLPVRPRGTATFDVLPLERTVEQRHIPQLLQALPEHVRASWNFLPLTNSHAPQLQGHLVGFGVWSADRELVSPHVLVEVSRSFESAADKLTRGHRVLRSRALEPAYWTGPAQRWVSTTPLRGFPDLRVLHHELAFTSKEKLGVMAHVRFASMEPAAPTHHRWSAGHHCDGLGLWWVELEFEAPVEGPLVLGSNTDQGFGVFRPLVKKEQ